MSRSLRLCSCTFVVLSLVFGTPSAVVADEDGPEEAATDGSRIEASYPASGRMARATVTPGRSAAPVRNESLSTVDPDTLERIEARWRHLRDSINRPRRDRLPPGDVPAEQIRPWAPPTESSPTVSSPTRPSSFGTNIEIPVNGQPSAAVPSGFSPTVPEPSVGAVGDRVFFTGNWYAAWSTDGGISWSYVNPYAGPFPEPENQDFCCDQQAHYDPGSNTLFWSQQLRPTMGGAGTQRVNVDRDADGGWDCFYDITPQDAGLIEQTLLDFPDLALSDAHLFVATDAFITGTGDVDSLVARLSLADLTTCAATTYDIYLDSNFSNFRLSQGARDVMYFADHATTTSIEIWSWPATAAAPSSVTRPVQPFLNGERTCPGPDGLDWCGRLDSRALGGAVAGDRVAFLWHPQQNPAGGFPFPYTQGIVLDAANGLAVVDEPLIWSTDAAWVYASLGANADGGFGGSILSGGGSFFPRCSVFLVDDENGDRFTPLEHEIVVTSASGPELNRSGDYLATRADAPNGRTFVGTCMAYPTQSRSEARFLRFGRASAFSDLFADGFESGDAGSWSAAVP